MEKDLERAAQEDRSWAMRESTCLACPKGCRSCTKDQDCECYDHQDLWPEES